MGIDISARKADRTKQEEGIWATFGDGPRGFVWWLDGDERPLPESAPTARVRVAWAGSRKATEFLRSERKKYARIARQLDGELPEEIEKKIQNRLIASYLLDWEGVQAGGKDVAYSPEAALELVEASEDFRFMVAEIATETRAFREQQKAAKKEKLGN